MTMECKIRPWGLQDQNAVATLLEVAFDALPANLAAESEPLTWLPERADNCLSLVAEGQDGEIIGYVALSHVTLSTGELGWVSLGPMAVLPEYQGHGIGSALVLSAKGWMFEQKVQGCVANCAPRFGRKFGWHESSVLQHPGPVSDECQVLLVNAVEAPQATVVFHPAFVNAHIQAGFNR